MSALIHISKGPGFIGGSLFLPVFKIFNSHLCKFYGDLKSYSDTYNDIDLDRELYVTFIVNSTTHVFGTLLFCH